MSEEERDWLIRLIANPPPGSKLAAAKEFGIDLTLFIRRLGMTPTQRMRDLEAGQAFFEELRKSVSQRK